MRLLHIGASAALLNLGAAFLVPSTISSDSKSDLTLPFEVSALTDERVVEVNCPGCPVQTSSEGLMRWTNAESLLRFNVTVARGNTDRLMVNGLQVYPVDTSIDILTATLTADQLIKSPDDSWVYSSTPKLGYALRMRHPLTESSEKKHGLGLVSFHLEIIEVGNKFVRGIPSLTVVVVETNSGQLMIGDAHTEVATMVKEASNHPHGKPKCSTLLCKWRAMVTAKTSALKKGCGGKSRPHGLPRPHGIKGGPNKFPHHRPHGSFKQGHHHQRPHHSTAGRLFQSIAFHIVVPILIGVVVGITASLVGMIVGHIVIFVWRLLFRRGERGQYCRVEQNARPTKVDEETKAFLENQGPPPVYEDDVIIIEEKFEQK